MTDLKTYDNWVIKNQKPILDWTKKYSTGRYADIRDAFAAYNKAKTNKSKIEAFENLKKSLVSANGVKYSELVGKEFTNLQYKLKRSADATTEGDISKLPRYTDSKKFNDAIEKYDILSPLHDAMSTIPGKVDNYDYVELKNAFKDNYNYNEMKALAAKYNYDYENPKDRKEFLKHVSDIDLQRLKQEAYEVNDIPGMITQMTYPVSYEHARKYDELSPLALGADLLGQAAMMGAGGWGADALNAGTNARILADLTTAPVITEAGQVLSNEKELDDAVKDALVGAATNTISPAAIQGYGTFLTRPFGNEVKQGAKAAANKTAQEAEQIIRAKNNGVPYRNIPDLTEEENKMFSKLMGDEWKQFQADHPNVPIKDLFPMWSQREATLSKEIMAKAKQEALAEWKRNQTARNLMAGKTGIYRKNWKGKVEELTPHQAANTEFEYMNLTPADREKERLFWRWNTDKSGRETADRKIVESLKKGERIPDQTLVQGGYTESLPNMLYRKIGRTADNSLGRPVKNLLTNTVGASTRLTDRKLGLADRYFNLPWKYGAKDKSIDENDPTINAYKMAYARWLANEDYFDEPPKPKGVDDEVLKELQSKIKPLSIKYIFGE